MAEWQPIETAPKDESEFIAFIPGVGVKVVTSWSAWGGGTGHFHYETKNHWKEPEWERCEPTHWMPYPAPPMS